MPTLTGPQLAEGIRSKVEELKKLCEGIDEATASRAPAGRWSPKEILSHLCGREGIGHVPMFQAFLDNETPLLDLEVANTFFTENRANLTFAQLLSEIEQEYKGIALFTTRLSGEQLARKAHMPAFKEAPFGEFPTLGDLLGVLGEKHLQFHIDHMSQVLSELGIHVPYAMVQGLSDQRNYSGGPQKVK